MKLRHDFLMFGTAIIVFMAINRVPAQVPDTLWTRTFGGAGDDVGNSVRQTSDGGFIVVGTTGYEYCVAGNVYLIRTDVHGDTNWTRTFGGSGCDLGECVQQTLDGGYVICGTTTSFGAGNSDMYAIRIDAGGDTLWTRTFGGSGWDEAHYVRQTSDGGYIFVGNSTSFGGCDWDAYLVKTDYRGEVEWSQVYAFYSNYWEFGYNVLELSEGGYIVLGKAAVYSDSYDILLIRTDDHGDTLWTKIYDREGDESAFSIAPTSDGGFIITGMEWTLEGYLYLIKTDADFDTLWTRAFNGGYHSWGYCGQQVSDSGYIAVGWASGPSEDQDVYVVRMDADGDSLWTRRIGSDHRDEGRCVLQTSDGNYIIAGSCEDSSGVIGDIWLICLGNESSVAVTPSHVPHDFALNSPYPNPFNSSVIISYSLPAQGRVRITIHNIIGELVMTVAEGMTSPGLNSLRWDAGSLASGIYFCRMEAEGSSQVRKMLLLR
jgi:hypothetical protein